MSDEEFELEKQIANVSQLKSFSKFMNNYMNKKETAQPPPSHAQKEVTNRSNQKLAQSYEKNSSFDRQYDVTSPKAGHMTTIKEEHFPSQFDEKLSVSMENQERQRQRSTQQKPPASTRRRQRDFSRATAKDPSVQPPPVYAPTVPPQHYKQPYLQSSFPPSNPQNNSYKTKFEQLSSTFQQFKNTSIVEKREQKQKIYQYEEKIEQYKARIYELEVREDELTMENKKLREKITKEFKSQKETQSLKAIIESRNDELRRAVEEINYYRGQLETSRKELQSMNLENQRFQLELREYRERLECQQMQVENKESLQKELSEKISGLIKENAKLRDEVSELFRTNKELEYENYNMKRELQRGQSYGSQVHNQSYTNLKQSHRIQRGQEPIEPPRRPQTKRRRGQFNQQRQKLTQRREVTNRSQIQSSKREPNPMQELLHNKLKLQQQVTKMREERVLSGAMRRKKIDLERDLEAVYKKLQELSGEAQLRI